VVGFHYLNVIPLSSLNQATPIFSLIVGRIAMRPYEKRRIWANLAWIERDEKG
jgi:hypothetical protein